ncbi:hypothetical protein CKA32_000137 [Geitlerinema sp. FC II]|nr:hypothetical protein CKA32_000137 [Geitlerinema sp. FC II]
MFQLCSTVRFRSRHGGVSDKTVGFFDRRVDSSQSTENK